MERWWTNGEWKCLLSILLAVLLPTRDWHKVSADLYLRFRASCASTWTHLSRLTNVLKTLIVLKLQPTKLRTLTWNNRAVSQCIRNARLKLTIEKCHFGRRQIEFFERTISSEGVSPQSHKIQNFLSKSRIPKSKKALQRYLGFV